MEFNKYIVERYPILEVTGDGTIVLESPSKRIKEPGSHQKAPWQRGDEEMQEEKMDEAR